MSLFNLWTTKLFLIPLFGITEIYGLMFRPLFPEHTHFKTVGLSQFGNYGDYEVFSHISPPDTLSVVWTFGASKSKPECPSKMVHIFLRHGSLPLVIENNKTFPADFVLETTESHHINVVANGSEKPFTLQGPLFGTWYAAAYVDKTQSEAVGKLTDIDCDYSLQVNVSRYSLSGIQILPLYRHTKLTVSENLFYKFYIEEDVWQYTVRITDCRHGNQSLSPCPLILSMRGAGIPQDSPYQTTILNCSSQTNGSDCSINISSPIVQQWHYLVVRNTISKDVEFTLKVSDEVCAPSSIMKALELHRPSKRDVSSLSSGTGQISRIIISNVTLHNSSDSSLRFEPSSPESKTDSNFCDSIKKLARIENPNSPTVTDFTFQANEGTNLLDKLNVTEGKLAVVRFDLSDIKDIGSTLVILLQARLQSNSLNDTHDQNMTLTICIQRSAIPVNGSHLVCRGQSSTLQSNLMEFRSPAFVERFPYPEAGAWFIAAELQCFNTNTSLREPCLQSSLLAFQVSTAPCDAGTCSNSGICRQTLQGGVLQSYCRCIANYRGFICGDNSEASPKRVQLGYTLLLTLSNLFFIPAIRLATYRHYYTEALVYFANMFFSTFYHACDEDPFSLYKLCILPYHPLQYGDFLLSILSFWVTLLVVASIQQPWRSLLEMLGAVVMAIVVEWQTHNMWVNLVPICVGVGIVIVSWTVKSLLSRKCFPAWKRLLCALPGIILAIIGLCIFGFLETDDNYAFTHSAWHVCVSSAIIFLLPKRTIQVKEEPISDSFELDDSDQRNLIQSASPINALDPDDLNL